MNTEILGQPKQVFMWGCKVERRESGPPKAVIPTQRLKIVTSRRLHLQQIQGPIINC